MVGVHLSAYRLIHWDVLGVHLDIYPFGDKSHIFGDKSSYFLFLDALASLDFTLVSKRVTGS